jgi:hypothetical protein
VSLAITGDALAIADTSLLTIGTGAQAWASLAEFRSLKQSVPVAARYAVGTATLTLLITGGGFDLGLRLPRFMPAWLRNALSAIPNALIAIAQMIFFTLIFFPSTIAQVRTEGGNEAVQLARFLRLAVVWSILTAGSALALIAAVIQLALA